MNFYISDLHFGHKNIIKNCKRPFSSVEEMDETLIANWNRKVGKNDTVYIVGDMVWRDVNAMDYLPKLKGKKILIEGNHEEAIMRDEEAKACFSEITKFMEVSNDNHQLTLCHYPMLEWKGSRKQYSPRIGYLIYGHTHNRTEGMIYQTILSFPNALNAGVDVNNFEPCTFKELYENNMRFKKQVLSSELYDILLQREEDYKE